jgi:hypothetical protein
LSQRKTSAVPNRIYLVLRQHELIRTPSTARKKCIVVKKVHVDARDSFVKSCFTACHGNSCVYALENPISLLHSFLLKPKNSFRGVSRPLILDQQTYLDIECAGGPRPLAGKFLSILYVAHIVPVEGPRTPEVMKGDPRIPRGSSLLARFFCVAGEVGLHILY